MKFSGQLLRELRESKSWTMAQLGEKLASRLPRAFPKQTIWQYEHEERTPSLVITIELCNILGVEIHEIMI